MYTNFTVEEEPAPQAVTIVSLARFICTHALYALLCSAFVACLFMVHDVALWNFSVCFCCSFGFTVVYDEAGVVDCRAECKGMWTR
jgi:hypothetical protein